MEVLKIGILENYLKIEVLKIKFENWNFEKLFKNGSFENWNFEELFKKGVSKKLNLKIGILENYTLISKDEELKKMMRCGHWVVH